MKTLKGEIMNRNQLWLADFKGRLGHEQQGIRPVVIVAKANGLFVVIPLTSKINRMGLSFTYLIESNEENGLTDDSVALVFQIISVDRSRFIRKAGKINDEESKNIDEVLKSMLKLG